MSNKTIKQTASRSAKRSSWVALTLACGLAIGGPASASMPVVDVPHTVQNILSQLRAYYQQYQQYRQQITQYMQTIVTIQGMSYSMLPTEGLKERPLTYRMQERCGGSLMSSVTDSLKDQTSLDPEGSITSRQTKVCQEIVVAENRRYNEAVKMMKTLMETETKLKAIEMRRQAASGDKNSEGLLAANTNDVERLLATTSQQLEARKTTIEAYNYYIQAKEVDQKTLANMILQGQQGNIVSDAASAVVQGATLKAALQQARSD